MTTRRPHPLRTLALAAALCLSVSNPATAADADLVASLDGIFTEAFPADGPGAAVRVEKDGEVILRKGYGLADLELGVPIEPDMVFRLGSITKQFTGAAILMLVEDGKVELDAPLSTYLPEYDGPAAKVTVAQLLNHSGGIPNYTESASYIAAMRNDEEPDAMVDRFRQLDLEFEPGTRWSYSNSGYFLLGRVIEAASGETYEELVESEIFEPLEMTGSRYGHTDELVPRRVEGYDGQDGDWTPASYLSMTQPYAAGSLLSTVDDLARWNAALRDGEILTPEHRKLLGEAVPLTDGASSGYSYGFFVGDYAGHRVVQHGGGINGFSTHMLRVPDEDLFIAVLTNSTAGEPGNLATQALDLLLDQPLAARAAVDLPAAALDELVGVYAIGGPDSDEIRVLSRDGEHLVSQRSGGQAFPIRFTAPDRFFYPESATTGRIERDEAGAVTGMWVTPVLGPESYAVKTDRPIPAERQVIDLDPAKLDRYVGSYELFANFQIKVFREGDTLKAQATGQPAFEIYPESETRFFVKVVDATIDFEGIEDGEADSIVLHQGGRDMPGARVED